MKKSAERKVNRIISRKFVITFLLLVSFLMTSSTFAYWADIIEGTTNDITTSFFVGSPSFVDYAFIIDSEDDTYEYEIDKLFLLDDPDNNSEEVVFGIIWNDEDLSDELIDRISKGEIEISYEIVITKYGNKATKNQQNRYSRLIKIDFDENNPDSINYNDSAETFRFSVSLKDENRRNDYKNLKNKFEVTIVITFDVIED